MAYLADVYVTEPHRGRGLGVELVREMIEGAGAPDVHWLLHTRDAQELYQRLGFRIGRCATRSWNGRDRPSPPKAPAPKPPGRRVAFPP